MSKCIIFSAPSGSGKTTIVRQLLLKPELRLEFSISATTRAPRGQEINGKDYYFLSVEEFRKKIDYNELIEWEEVYKNSYYGTPRAELDRIWRKGNNVVFDVDVKGGLSLKKIFSKDALAIFIKPPSIEILEQRLRDRNLETEDKIQERLARAKYELSFEKDFDVCIENDILEKAIKQTCEAILKFINS